MPRRSLRSASLWLSIGASVPILVWDVVFPTDLSGIAALVAMCLSLLWLGRRAEIDPALPADADGVRRLFRVEVALAVVALGFAIGRGVVLQRTLFVRGDPGPGLFEAARLYDLLFLALAVSAELILWRAPLLARLVQRLGSRPPLTLAASFAAMIAAGTLALCLPWSVDDVADVSFVDALFTMTSAVCVTGLVVNDVGATYTPFGELVILLGIQFGGIGIMSLGAAALTLRRDPSLRMQADYAAMLDADNLKELRVLVRTIVTSTFAIEIAGALCLAWIWHGDPRLEGRSIAWVSVFHAVSAFCNAGFSLFPANLGAFVGDPAPQAVIALLVLLGGIGFPVYLEIGRRIAAHARGLVRGEGHIRRRFDLGPRVALQVSGILVAAGALLILCLEWSQALGGLDVGGKLCASVFSSIVARTAGFNTVDFGAMRASTLLVVIVLMWIGGSPSSTAGGIKTTAGAVLFATFVGETRGHEPRLGGRALGSETVRRATAVAALGLATVGLSLFLLCLTESADALGLAFEATSAFSTTGLSTGITPTLSTAGRFVLVATMFVGRLGPMTVALAIGRARRAERYRLPSHEIAVW